MVGFWKSPQKWDEFYKCGTKSKSNFLNVENFYHKKFTCFYWKIIFKNPEEKICNLDQAQIANFLNIWQAPKNK